jgi:hypothetical protein
MCAVSGASSDMVNTRTDPTVVVIQFACQGLVSVWRGLVKLTRIPKVFGV